MRFENDAGGAERRNQEPNGGTDPGYPDPPRIGLTGAIGAGKSSVGALLAVRGARVLDADAFARAATDDPEVVARIAAEVGADLVPDGRLDRNATAARIFADPAARRALERIVHPWVRAAAAAAEVAARAERPPPPLIVHDVPLLFENRLDDGMDATIVVAAPFAVRAARLATRSGLPEAAVRARDAAQLDPAEKARRATFVIDNGGDERALAAAVAAAWPSLVATRRTC